MNHILPVLVPGDGDVRLRTEVLTPGLSLFLSLIYNFILHNAYLHVDIHPISRK